MKDEILKLRAQGKSYNQIIEELGCSKSTVSYHCGKGQREKNKARTYIRRSKKNEQAKASRLHRKEFLWRYKSMCGCARCGYNEHPIALDFDHLDPSKKSAGVSELAASRAPMRIIKEEIRKCQVLCANCHRLKGL